MKNERVRVGVVGAGRMGQYHLQKYLQIPGAELVGFFDSHPERALELSARFGVKHFPSLAELFFEVDAVTVATPTSTHYAIARQALEAGVDVLVEKPMTETVAEAEALIQLAEEKELLLQIGFIERFRYQALAKSFPLAPIRFIESDRLSSTLNREPSVDVVADLMIHDLDLALSLIGEEPSSVSAVGVPILTGHCDIANVRLEFPSGAVANLNASRVSARTFRKFRVFSLKAYASLDFMTNGAEIYSRNAGREIECATLEPSPVDALQAQSEQFVSCVRERRAPLVSGRDGLLALKYAGIVRAKIDERNALAFENGIFASHLEPSWT